MDTLSEERGAIDRIDEQLIALLAARFKAVRRAAELKGAPHEARVTWRVEEVARQVREAATGVGLDADGAEGIWRGMMEECIAYERRALGQRVTNRQEERR